MNITQNLMPIYNIIVHENEIFVTLTVTIPAMPQGRTSYRKNFIAQSSDKYCMHGELNSAENTCT